MTPEDEIAAAIGFFYYYNSIGNSESDKIEDANIRVCNLGIT